MKKLLLFLVGIHVGISVFIGIAVGSFEGFWPGVISGLLWPVGLIISIIQELLK